MPSLVLASASPRRAELLTQMGLTFTVSPANIDETPKPGEQPDHYVLRMAEEKALAGWRADGHDGVMVLGSDTSVVRAGRILGKPASAAEAGAMLRDLSGQHHQVMTAVALVTGGHCQSRLVVTDVAFRPLLDAEIEAYVASGEPMDKAGGYGIQGLGGVFVDQIRGSYSAVVGLPLKETAELLAEAGQPVWQAWSGSGRDA